MRTIIAATAVLLVTNVTYAEETAGRLLAASFGADNFGGLGPCAGQASIDGLPVVFDRPLDVFSVDPQDFVIVTATGERVQPQCASFFPSVNRDERQTILTQGNYGSPGNSPLYVEIVGPIQSADGAVNYQGQSIFVVPFEIGAILVYAQRLPLVSQLGGPDQCPNGTRQVIQLAFGSNAGNNFPVTPDYLGRFQVELRDGTIATPVTFADVTFDNYLELCLDATSPAVNVHIAAETITDASGQLNEAPLSAPVD